MGYLVSIVQKVLDFESTYYEVHSKKEIKPYGIIYHNETNPLSWDSNHAHITKFHDIATVVNDIKVYYISHNIIPRIFLLTKKITDIDLYLKDSSSWSHLQEERVYLVQKSPKKIQITQTIVIKQIFSITQTVENIMLMDNDFGDWSYKTLQDSIKKPYFFMFAGYVKEKIVCIGSLNVGEEIGKVDHVHTEKSERNKGYCSQLINYITDFNAHNFNVTLYLYSDNPIAIRIYEKCGYKPIEKVSLRNYWLTE